MLARAIRQYPACWWVAAILAQGCDGGDGVGPGPTVRVERARIERIVVAAGTIEPVRKVDVRPRIAGIIEAIHVDDGDRVEKDQPLVEIERARLASRVREAEAAVDHAVVEYRDATIARERSRMGEGRDATSEEARDEADARYRRARAEATRAKAGLDTLATQLSDATVRAPAAGRVLRVHVEEGDAVSPASAATGGTVLLTLAGAERLTLKGRVDEDEVDRIAMGQAARVRTETYPDRSFAGRVADIAPIGGRIGDLITVEIEIVDPDAPLLRSRTSADAEIVAQVVPDALVVPQTALRHRGDAVQVDALVRGGEARVVPKDVEIGIVDGGRVQITRGLAEGEEVLLR